MTDLRQPNREYKRLRDFGAFEADLAMLDTYEMRNVQINHPAPSPSQNRAEMLTPNFESCAYNGSQASPLPKVAKLIPFPTTPPPLSQRQGGELSSQQQIVQKPVTMQGVKRKKWLSMALRFGVTLLLFIFLFKSMSWSTLLQALTQVHVGKMLLGLIVGAFSIVISSYQWRSLLRAEQIKYDLAGLIDLYLVGISFSHFLPTGMGGDVVKAVQVGRESKNSAGSASAVLMSRITGFLGMLLIAYPVLIIWRNQFSSEIVIWFLTLSLIVGGMLGGTMGVATLLPKLSYKRRWANHRIFASAVKIGDALKASIRRPYAMGVAILFGIEFWIVGCLNYYGYGVALGIHIPLYYYFVAIPFVSLVTFLPISINGFGVREAAFVSIFSAAHVPSTTSLLLALFMDAQVLLFGIIGGYIYLSLGYKKKSSEKMSQRRIA